MDGFLRKSTKHCGNFCTAWCLSLRFCHRTRSLVCDLEAIKQVGFFCSHTGWTMLPPWRKGFQYQVITTSYVLGISQVDSWRDRWFRVTSMFRFCSRWKAWFEAEPNKSNSVPPAMNLFLNVSHPFFQIVKHHKTVVLPSRTYCTVSFHNNI